MFSTLPAVSALIYAFAFLFKNATFRCMFACHPHLNLPQNADVNGDCMYSIVISDRVYNYTFGVSFNFLSLMFNGNENLLFHLLLSIETYVSRPCYS